MYVLILVFCLDREKSRGMLSKFHNYLMFLFNLLFMWFLVYIQNLDLGRGIVATDF